MIAFVLALLALPRADAPASKAPQYGGASGPPGPSVRDDFKQPALPVTGPAPWALSALPECFRQLARASGPAAFVRRHLPREARRLQPGVTLRVADCSVAVGIDSALVTRGENRLLVPAVARFYLERGHLVLERQLRAGRKDVRVFALRAPYALLAAPGTETPRPPLGL